MRRIDRRLTVVKRLVTIGQCDAVIAVALGTSTLVVSKYRRSLGLKANRMTGTRYRCDGCGALSPIPIGRNWAQKIGWVRRPYFRLPNGREYYVIFCGHCAGLEPNPPAAAYAYTGAS